MRTRARKSTSPKSRRDRSCPTSSSKKSAAIACGTAIVPDREKRRRSRRNSKPRKLSAHRSARRLDLLLRHLEQLLLGVEARALNRLGKLDPLHVVDLAELRLQLSTGEHHQIEVDALATQHSTCAEKVLDCVKWFHDRGDETGLFVDFAQRRLLRSLAVGDGAFR